MLNCTTGTIENSHFSKWTPLTGVYIAAATLVCTIAIIVDLVQGLRCKLCWIPSGYSSINSVSLTILGAATKLSTDLSTTMPQHMDQLAKLGTSAFMCIALANVYPSLGKLENSELQSNTVALSILVISSIVSVFDSEEVDPLDSQESPPNCWSLHLVTLMEIAVALPNVDRHSLCELIKGVNEGLVFVKLIEDKFNQELHFSAIKCGAYFLWMKKFGLKSFKDLVKPAVHNESPMEILESIATSAKKKSIATDGWAEVVAHSKYRLCEKILLEHRNENGSSRDDLQPCPMSGRIFAKLRATIADILGACLANLKHYILTECSDSSSIEKRREAAARILKLFGNAEKIMEIVERREIPDMSPEKMVYIDNWRDYYKSQRQSP